MAANIFGRYVWLVDTLLRRGRLTYDEINALWKRSGLSYGDKDQLPIRTFHNHKNAISDIFQINIECDTHDGYRYYIANPECIGSDSLRAWLISSYATLNQIHADRSLEGRIVFEDVPSGNVWLTTITEAMRRDRVIRITHQGFEQPRPRTFEIEPYHVKVFMRRWYVLGRNPYYSERDGRDVYRSYALDRISNVEETDRAFRMKSDFDVNEYFAGCCGIVTTDRPAVRVVIRAYKLQPEYFKTLPLHSSQRILEEGDDHTTFEYILKPTFDFYQLLLSMMDRIEVLEPQEVRDQMREYARNILGYYDVDG